MRRYLIWLAVALAVPVFILVALVVQSGRQVAPGSNLSGAAGEAGQQYIGSTPTPEPVVASNQVAPIGTQDTRLSPPAGVPAIDPPVTEEKVRDYVTANRAGGEVVAKDFRIDTVKLGTVREMKEWLKSESQEDVFFTNFPLDRPMVYVVLRGDFTFSDMDNVEHVYPRAFMIFDGTTGNLLIQGSGPEHAQPQPTPQPSGGGLTPIPTGNPAPDPIATAKSSGRATPSTSGSSAITPPVTEEKVRAYLASNPSVHGVMGRNVQVDSVRSVTVAELQTLLPQREPFLDEEYKQDEQLVYATLGGDFSLFDDEGKETVYHSSYRVFDAVTGNELFGGVEAK